MCSSSHKVVWTEGASGGGETVQTPMTVLHPDETRSNDSNVFDAYGRVGALIRQLRKEVLTNVDTQL